MLALAASGCASRPAFAPENVEPTGLTKAQAKQILIVVLTHERKPIDGLGTFIDDDLRDKSGEPPHPGYFDFSLGYDSPGAGATEYMGLYAVSSATGDVWELNRCEHYDFPELRRIQAKISHRTHRTVVDEKDLRRGLGC
jgi:hypothetical protein